MIEFIKTLLLEAGKQLERHAPTVVREKEGGGNWVTEADLAVERFIVKKIREQFPDDFILAEESALAEIPDRNSRLWLVDPLDGTASATFGLPYYGISIAFMEDGEVSHGAILDIPRKKLYWAGKEQGAFVEKNRLEIKNRPLSGSIVATGAPYGREDFQEVHRIMDKVHAAGARLQIIGSTVVTASYVAEGKYSLFYEIGLKPWDIAAASLLVEEAGGVVRSFIGMLDILNPREFVCGNKTAVKEFLSLIPHRRGAL